MKNFKFAANWINGPVRKWLNENNCQADEFPLPEQRLAALIVMVVKNEVSHSIAAERIFPELIQDAKSSPGEIAAKLDLLQNSDEKLIEEYVDLAVKNFPGKVKEYHNGKKGLVGFFMGEVMKISNGKADPKVARELLNTKLDNQK